MIQTACLQPARRRLEDRLPDVALVELGVADQRDEASAGPAELAVVVHVALRRARRTAARRRRAPPTRSSSRRGPDPSSGSGRPAGRRSRAACAGTARRASPSRYSRACSTGEACGLTTDAVVALQLGEPERRHDRDQARGRGLVAADLDRVERWAARGSRGRRCAPRARGRAARCAGARPRRALAVGESPGSRSRPRQRPVYCPIVTGSPRARDSQASTVTSVPIGVNGQICFAVSSWSSTQPRLWGVP